MSSLIEVKDVRKTFKVGEQDIEVLKGINIEIAEGDFAIIMGPSGCGKSTLLHIMLGLEPPTVGELNFLNINVYANSTEDDRSDFRKNHIGMVYQQANWIKSLTVEENVAFPLILIGEEKETAIQKAHVLLDTVGMKNWATYMPTELSSGQQQRVSLARALVNNPKVIVADEPTGNLDYESGQLIMRLLANLNKENGKTIVMVTHDLEYISFAKSAIQIMDGSVIGVYAGKDKEKMYKNLHFKRGTETNKKDIKREDKKDDSMEKIIKEANAKDLNKPKEEKESMNLSDVIKEESENSVEDTKSKIEKKPKKFKKNK